MHYKSLALKQWRLLGWALQRLVLGLFISANSPVLINMVPRFSLVIGSKVFKVDCHHQQSTLQASCDNQNSPYTPTSPPLARGQATRPDKTSRRLDAHHWDTQAAHTAQPERSVNLREVLDGREHSGQHTKEVRPGWHSGWLTDSEGDRDYDRHEGMQQA
jgi:hypothetical protein